MTVRARYSSNSIFPLLAKLPATPDLRASTRRSSARRPISVRVEIEGRTDAAWTLNISRGGVRIVADVRLDVGEEISIKLGDEPAKTLRGRGRVVWVQRQGEDVVAGIRFLSEAA